MRSREDELILMKHKHGKMLDMFRDVLTKVSNLKHSKLHVNVSAMFQGDDFHFDITVFTSRGGDNRSLIIYDFWELKESQKLIDEFLLAIETGDFEKVKAARRGY